MSERSGGGAWNAISTFMRITDIQIIFLILIAYESAANRREAPVFTCMRVAQVSRTSRSIQPKPIQGEGVTQGPSRLRPLPAVEPLDDRKIT